MTETLAETRARFRREFPTQVMWLESYVLPLIKEGKDAWELFAVGAGHGHDAKFKDEVDSKDCKV